MGLDPLKRAALRAVLAAGAALQRPIVADGQTMDPTMAALVRLANVQGRGAGMTLDTLRTRYAAAPGITGLRRDPRVRVAVVDAGGRPGRRYEPRVSAGNMLYLHGGGFILGSLETHDALCRRLAVRTGLSVTAIDYRLAPEHPFPAAHEDAAAAWASLRAGRPGPWVVAGDSAGANLAAGLALDGSARLQILIYPVVDMLHQDGLYPSVVQFADGFLLTADGMRECARLLIPPGKDPADPRLSPIRADLSRASPALVVTAGFDPLRDQGRAYHMALHKAGVASHLLEESRLPHGFADFAGVVPAARRAVDRIADWVQSALE